MIVVTLVKQANNFNQPILEQLLTTKDAILLTATSMALAFHGNFYLAPGFIRASDAKLLPGSIHADWRIIDDQQWTELLVNADKVITW